MREGAGRPSNGELRSREAKFLLAYLDPNSLTYGQQIASGIEAGYSKKNTKFVTGKVLARYRDKSFRDSCEALGMTKPYLAARLKLIIENDGAYPRDILAAVKMLLSNLGEKTEDGRNTVNVNTPKALVLVGMDKKSLAAMTSPQLEEPDAVSIQSLPIEVRAEPEPQAGGHPDSAG